MTTTALTTYEHFDTMQRAATALYKSGYFDDAKSQAQAIVKVMAGAELGIAPFAAMSGIHVIKGKPVIGSNLMAALVKTHPIYNYRILEHTAKICRIEFYENGQPLGESSFTVEQARKAGVGGVRPPGKPASMLEMHPENMLFSRAMSNGVRWFCPDIFSGAPVYTGDELGASTDADGDIVEGEVSSPPDYNRMIYGADDDDQPPADTVTASEFYATVMERLPYYDNQFHVNGALGKLEIELPTTRDGARAAFIALRKYAEQRAAEKAEQPTADEVTALADEIGAEVEVAT